MYAKTVHSVDLAGSSRVEFRLETQPSGLAFREDGRLLVVSMEDRKLLLQHGPQLRTFVELSELASYHANDLVIGESGDAYVGNFGFDFMGGEAPKAANLIRVTPQGEISIAAGDLMFPNGMAISADGRTLIVGETYANRLTAFTLDPDGRLGHRRPFATFLHAAPDGICMDSAGGIWLASPPTHEVLRVEEGGRVTHRLRMKQSAIACMLGGPSGRTLFILSAPLTRPAKGLALRLGRIDMLEVEFGRTGRP
jgi:sugar lactone lactonase YvrE